MLFINLEKNKIFSKILLKNKKNIRIYLKNEGCYNNKYLFFYTKKINKNDIVIKIKKKKIIFYFFEYINLNKILIKIKKNIKIKNKNIKKICDCKFSFNF